MKSGVLILDKAAGMTSQTAVTRVKRALEADKAGHGGTLDPGVTGVLPVFLGKATRLAEFVLESGKAYEGRIVFGRATDTYDRFGETIAEGDPALLTETDIRSAVELFKGWIDQVPPPFSAVKKGGVKLYEMARAGRPIEVPPRKVYIMELRVTNICLTPEASFADFAVDCGKGTYIRALCHDVGRVLGVPAHMGDLRRTRSGPFQVGNAYTLEDLSRGLWELVLPPEVVVSQLPRVDADADAARRIGHGAGITVDSAELPGVIIGDRVRVHGESGELLAIYEALETPAGLGSAVELAAAKVLV